MSRTLQYETAARVHEREAIVEALLGRQEKSRRHLMAAIALAQEARFERALTTSRAPTPEDERHAGHVAFDPTCRICFQRLDAA